MINWNQQAKQFLRLHGWHQDKDNPFNPKAWFHPAFPLGQELIEKHEEGKRKEDIEHGYETAEEFVTSFYGKAWEAYKLLIQSLHVLKSKPKEKPDPEDDLQKYACEHGSLEFCSECESDREGLL